MTTIRYNKVVIDAPKIYVHPIGDVHYGHEMCDKSLFLETLLNIPHDPAHRILLMGDLLDIGIKSAIGGSVYDNPTRINQALDDVCTMIEPWREQIDGVVVGNHEWRLYKDCGIDIMEMLCRALHLPYMKHAGVTTYSMGRRAYSVHYIHGKGGGGLENALRVTKAMSNKVFADVYLMGHVHATAKSKRQFKMPDSRNATLTELTQHFVLTGHCLDYDDSYADQMNLEINTKGFPTIVLHGDTPKKEVTVMD